MSKCFSCTKDLSKARKKYAWLLVQGFDPKDASVEILREPDSKIPPSQCCITSLQTNIKLEDHVEYQNKIKERIAKKERGLNEALPPRELFTIYPFSENGGSAELVLLDSPFSELDLLASGRDGQKIGYDIINITKAPEQFLLSKGWKNTNGIILWFNSRIKVICVEVRPSMSREEDVYDIGLLKIRNNVTGEEQILDPSNSKFLGAHIIEYSQQVFEITGNNGTVYNGQVGALIIEKIKDSENYYL